MSARERVLGAIRRRLGRDRPLEESLQAALTKRLATVRPGPQPAWEESAEDRFVTKSKAVRCSLAKIRSAQSIPLSVSEYLSSRSMSKELAAAPHPLLTQLDWLPELSISWRRAEAHDRTALSVAYAGVAETGTLALLSSADSPASLNFLPEVHIAVLPRQRIVRHQEDLWQLLQSESVPLPRALNLITGPSKTGDVEQTIVYGAHGPAHVHILITG